MHELLSSQDSRIISPEILDAKKSMLAKRVLEDKQRGQTFRKRLKGATTIDALRQLLADLEGSKLEDENLSKDTERILQALELKHAKAERLE
eukprot:COSAG03_NODE_10532_length_645_cov_0.805861_1_plen_91_part_10